MSAEIVNLNQKSNLGNCGVIVLENVAVVYLVMCMFYINFNSISVKWGLQGCDCEGSCAMKLHLDSDRILTSLVFFITNRYFFDYY